MEIIFYSNQLCERGTETALIDYAKGNRDILHNESILAFPKDRIFDQNRYETLRKEFDIILLQSAQDLNQELIERKIDLLYIIVDGGGKDIVDELVELNKGNMPCKTFVHAVFNPLRPHGDYYCVIHEFLNKYFFTHLPVLPHICKKLSDCKDDMRKELNIPQNATVFASYAGHDRFNLKFVREVVRDVAQKNSDIYFIFMNIDDFMKSDFNMSLPNVIFLPGSTDTTVKAKFINTCDAMLHARDDGETFGLSIAEFSSMNKPIITFKPGLRLTFEHFKRFQIKKILSYSRAHLMILGRNAITYRNRQTLSKKLIAFDKEKFSAKSLDVYTKKYSPEKVMRIFEHIINKK